LASKLPEDGSLEPNNMFRPSLQTSGPTNMKLLTHIPSWLKNKFFIALALFIGVIFFFDKNDLFTQMDRNRQLHDLLQSKQYFTDQIAAEQSVLNNMKTNPGTLEKYAREKYLMKRDNEDLFIIPEKSPETKN
jgi:cell division protein FtsB